MEAIEARTVLLFQHARLRDLLAGLRTLASRAWTGEGVFPDLDDRLHELREAFVAHNLTEETVLEPLLAMTGDWGPARIARMIEEHCDEHRLMLSFLSAPTGEIIVGLADFVEELEAHMAAEERTFLSTTVLR